MERTAPTLAGVEPGGDRAWLAVARARLGLDGTSPRHGSLFVRLSLATVGLLALMSAAIVGVTFWTRSVAVRETAALARAGHLQSLANRSRALGLAQDNITKAMLLEPEMMDLAVAKIDAYDESQAVLARMDSLAPVEIRRLTDQLHAIDTQELRPLDTRMLELMAASQLAEAK